MLFVNIKNSEIYKLKTKILHNSIKEKQSLPKLWYGNFKSLVCIMVLMKMESKSLCFHWSHILYIVSSYILFWGFLSSSVVENPPANGRVAGDAGSVAGLGRPLEEGNGNPLQYSCLGNPMKRGTWQATSPWGSQRVRHDWASKHTHMHMLFCQTEHIGCTLLT